MQNVLLVFIGGGLGCVARYISVLIVNKLTGNYFPWGTALVNITGCLLIGILLGIAITRPAFSNAIILFLVTGFLGGFTTFSAFSWETFLLLKNDGVLVMMQNIALNLIGCITAVSLGAFIGKTLA